MRSATKTFVGLASLGVMVATAKFGLANATTSSFGVAASTSATATAASTQTATQTANNPGATSTTATAGTGTTTTAKKTTKTKKSGTTASTGTGTTTGTAAGNGTSTGTTTPSTTAASVTKTSSAIQYRYGTVQLKVTRVSGKITDVTCVVCQATAGRDQAFPSLIQAAIDANGSNFGYVSHATFTTDAFKQALNTAK